MCIFEIDCLISSPRALLQVSLWRALLSVVRRPSVVSFSHFRHLQNRKSDWAETWWEALGLHGDSELLKSFAFRYPRWPPWRLSWNCSNELLPNLKSNWTETWWETSRGHEDSELLKLFRSDIQDGRHGGHLKIFKPHLLPNAKSN